MTTYIRPFTDEERIAAPLRKGTMMATHYESPIGNINGSTEGLRAKELQEVLHGHRTWLSQCHMRGPQARLLYLAGIKVDLTKTYYSSGDDARAAEQESLNKKRETRQDIQRLVDARESVIGRIPTRLTYLFNLFSIKGDIYNRSYLNRAVTHPNDRDYINRFFDITGKDAL